MVSASVLNELSPVLMPSSCPPRSNSQASSRRWRIDSSPSLIASCRTMPGQRRRRSITTGSPVGWRRVRPTNRLSRSESVRPQHRGLGRAKLHGFRLPQSHLFMFGPARVSHHVGMHGLRVGRVRAKEIMRSHPFMWPRSFCWPHDVRRPQVLRVKQLAVHLRARPLVMREVVRLVKNAHGWIGVWMRSLKDRRCRRLRWLNLGIRRRLERRIGRRARWGQDRM